MRTVPAAAGVCARLGRRPGYPLRPPIVGASRRARRRHQLPPPHKAADLLRDGVHATGRDRGERWADGQRTVSAAPDACHPAPVGRRDRSFALSRACCGLRRWTMPGALFCPTADRRPALAGPRVCRWARAVVFLAFHWRHHLQWSARGRRGGVELRSASRPRRDAWCTCARCARFAQLERVGDLGRDKPLTSRCSAQRVAVRRGGDLALALGESYVRGCRGSDDFKAWWRADPRLRAI